MTSLCVCVFVRLQLEVGAPYFAVQHSLSLFYFLSQIIILSLLPTEINVSICISSPSNHTMLDLQPLHRHCCFRKH